MYHTNQRRIRHWYRTALRSQTENRLAAAAESLRNLVIRVLLLLLILLLSAAGIFFSVQVRYQNQVESAPFFVRFDHGNLEFGKTVETIIKQSDRIH